MAACRFEAQLFGLVMEKHQGGCLCGAIRFEVSGAPKWTAYCHCNSCRKHTGAPVSAYAGYERANVVFTKGQLKKFSSSKGVERGFCESCGATLSYEGDRWPTEMHFHVGAFNAPEKFAPQGHAFEQERLSWLHLEPIKG
jgi:hypothetical protein